MICLSSLLFSCLWATVWCYDIVRDYSGSKFFDGWDFYGNYDNLTLGDVWWVNQADAFDQGLAYINNAGNAIIKVDNMHTVQFLQKRNSVRITTQASYAVGSLWIIDLVHLPYGCSVWPAFWTMGPKWPDDGEIDIIEAINQMPNNQMALHTTPGCTHTTPPNQMGRSSGLDCSQPSGCIVAETASNSFQVGFAENGGGVWATQFDISGIYIWFWSRPNVPPSITGATSTSSVDVSRWGPPSASFPSSTCNISQFFTPQKLVLDITLCGVWAGLPQLYLPSCSKQGLTGICYNDMVVGPGNRFNDAYFEIKYLRAYTTGRPAPTPSAPAAAIVSQATTTTPLPPANTVLHPSPLFYPGSGTRANVDGGTLVSFSLVVLLLGALPW